ncbi:GTP-binding protein [Candidatus Bathyarchaeota archaeon]|nr:GTP-binding protein [Candidatus Bathyarchaeota archaeon]
MSDWERIFQMFTSKLNSKDAPVNVVILGLDGAGKTTLLNYFVEGQATETIPTAGTNHRRMKIKSLEINLIDLGGRKAFRRFWIKSIQKSSFIIFVIDAAARERVTEANEALNMALSHFPGELPVLILLNKQDLPGAASMAEIMKRLDLSGLQERDWQVEEISAIQGNGVKRAFEWIKKVISYHHDTPAPFIPKDIIIFDRRGVPVVIKSHVFKEGRLAAGFLSAINSFVKAVAHDQLTSINMGKNKVLFIHREQLTGAIIISVDDGEKRAMDLLSLLMDEIIINGLENAEKTLSKFIMEKILDSKVSQDV